MTFAPTDILVWGEMPVSDLDKAMAFYGAVTGIALTRYDEGPNPMAVFRPMDTPGVAIHLYPGKPATDGNGPTLHLAAEGKLEDAMQRVKDAGGTVVSDPIGIPAGRFFYALDLDGNSVGFFEAA